MFAMLPLPADGPSPWLAVFGRCHLLVLHLPLGLLPALALLEFGGALLRRPAPRGAVLALAWLGALGGAAAIATGLALAGDGDHAGQALERHRLSAIAFGALLCLAALLAFLPGRLPFRVALLLACGAAVPAGHFGATLTHGAGFLTAPLAPRRGPPVAAAAAPPGTFAATVQPILDRTCVSCHNPDKRKGQLLLSTPEGVRAGGENGPVVVPGKPESSPLVVRCGLPVDDEDHMPPEGKPQPTADEVAVLRAWIAQGARFD